MGVHKGQQIVKKSVYRRPNMDITGRPDDTGTAIGFYRLTTQNIHLVTNNKMVLKSLHNARLEHYLHKMARYFFIKLLFQNPIRDHTVRYAERDSVRFAFANRKVRLRQAVGGNTHPRCI